MIFTKNIVEFSKTGDLVFNWDILPENVSSNTKLRDSIFGELQQKYPADEILNTKDLFEINTYVFKRIASTNK